MSEEPEDFASFRPSKRRKVFRKRVAEDAERSDSPAQSEGGSAITTPSLSVSQPPAISSSTTTAQATSHEDEDYGISDLVKAKRLLLLQQQRNRGGTGGIGFRVGGSKSSSSGGTGLEDVNGGITDLSTVMSDPAAVDEAAAQVADMTNRFAKQSGFKVEVDKHMMAYIDAELARREQRANDNAQQQLNMDSQLSPSDSSSSPRRHLVESRQLTATSGALQEVDLSSKPSDHNHHQPHNDPTNKTKKPPTSTRPPRLGPDGKPWRGGKQRHRRTSSDQARDALVDALLSENAPGHHEHYRHPAPTAAAAAATIASSDAAGAAGAKGGGPTTGSSSAGEQRQQQQQQQQPAASRPGMDEAADERVAAAFIRQFAEHSQARAMASGPRREKAPPGSLHPSQKSIANGPKLGGSRAQRAKMHAAEAEKLKAQGKH